MSRALRGSLAALAAGALLVAGCGGDGETSGDSAAGNETDRAFVAEMIPHHESAIEMAQIARKRGESAFVKELAADILRTQNEEISTMRSEDEQLAAGGVKVGRLGLSMAEMGMEHGSSSLQSADPFDKAFIAMMTPHHEGALEMSKVELDKGSDPELKQLAKEIIDGQTKEIAAMRAHDGAAGGGAGHAG